MADWLTLSQTEGTGNTAITITASTNSATTERNQSFKVTAQNKVINFIVLQRSDSRPISINPSIITLYGTDTDVVQVITNDAWTATTSDSAVTLSQTTGSGNTNVTVGYINNQQYEAVISTTVSFSTLNETVILTINHVLSNIYITAYYDIVRTGSTHIVFNYSYVERCCPYMSVDGGDWIPVQENYNFTTYGMHNIRYMGTKYFKKGGTTYTQNHYTAPEEMFRGLCNEYSGNICTDETHIIEVNIGEGFEKVEEAMIDNPYVQTVSLPSTLFKLEFNAIRFCSALTRINSFAINQPPLKNTNWWLDNYPDYGHTVSTLRPFFNINTGGVLHYPRNSDYSEWLSNYITDNGTNYNQLGYYGWTGAADL